LFCLFCQPTKGCGFNFFFHSNNHFSPRLTQVHANNFMFFLARRIRYSGGVSSHRQLRFFNGPLGRYVHLLAPLTPLTCSAALTFIMLASLAHSIHRITHSLRSLPRGTVKFINMYSCCKRVQREQTHFSSSLETRPHFSPRRIFSHDFPDVDGSRWPSRTLLQQTFTLQGPFLFFTTHTATCIHQKNLFHIGIVLFGIWSALLPLPSSASARYFLFPPQSTNPQDRQLRPNAQNDPRARG